MRIERADHWGMCFGVRDAIALARREVAVGPLTVLGELVHNETVLQDLRGHGVRFAHRPADVSTSAAMITAHGASQRAKTAARAEGLQLIEATCPLVHHAHRSLTGLVKEGYHPVIIGKAGHVEVRGMTEDLEAFDVVLAEKDIEEIEEHERFGVVAQTTQPLERVRRLVAMLMERFANTEVRFIDTVCRPTKERQTAAAALAKRSDVVIVVGGAKSNNTAELVRTCQRNGARAHHVQGPAEIEDAWLAGARMVGLTAGTSTPDELVDEVEARLRELTARWDREVA